MPTASLLRRLLPACCLLALLSPLSAQAAPRAVGGPAVAHLTQDDGWEDDAADDGWEDDGADGVDDGVDDPADAEPVDPIDDGWSDDGDDADPGDPAWNADVEPVVPAIEYVTGRSVAGRVAGLRRDGRAAIPRGAPKRVRRLIAAANRIVGKPYRWGGGHARLDDRGYDCSGTVSYALVRSGLLRAPMVSGSFAKWGRAEAGRWVTVYANRGHVYMEVAGLRLDTSPMGDPSAGKGPRWRPAIGWRRGFHVRHLPGL